MVKYKFIETRTELENIAALFETEDIVAVDLEADSMFHFKEKVCLIQMASKNHTAVIDPLQIDDLSSLKPLFANTDIRKIFHGSDYDVRSLHRDYGIEIKNLFDTELASRFIGVPETGLSSVLQKRFGVQLDKSYQKKDWSKRPLPIEMLDYGISDVAYLLQLADILDSELEEKKRTTWVSEECELLSRVRVPELNGAPLFLKIKGAGRLDRRALCTLEYLLEMRQKIAEKKDKPLFKIFSNSSLLTLAKERPLSLQGLSRTKAMSSKQISYFGTGMIEKIEMAQATPEKDLPIYPRKRKPAIRPEIPGITQKIKDWRDKIAIELELDPPILFNKALLTAIAVRKPRALIDLDDIAGLKKWQKNEFGDGIIQLLKTVK